MKAIISYNISVLDQLGDLLSKIYPVEYTLAIPLLYNSSLGKHTRHIIEFYICFFEAQNTGLINYDARKRDLRLETDIAFVAETIEGIKLALNQINSDNQLELTSEMPHNTGVHTGITTLSRELNYLADHTVHHLALIKIGTNLMNPQIELADNFGVAASTINYQK